MRGTRGQTHVLAILVAALAAIAITGMLEAQDRLLSAARTNRAGEAAAEAAGSVVADRHLAFVRTLEEEPSADRLAALLAEPRLEADALAAARELARANGGAEPARALIRDAGREISIELAFADGSRQLVTIEKLPCCLR